jgi:hypothetical protein
MSFSKTNKSCELPIFKDKVMYISSSESNIKMEQSYVISASYNGILRLSPNNYNTIYEVNPVELSSEQDQSLSHSYSDAIVFDNNSLVENEINDDKTIITNADIRYRMIIGSDSDGYLVGFRLSDEDVEFDNLGVIGITKTSKLHMYDDSVGDEQIVIKIGKTIMPTFPNYNGSSRGQILQLLKNHEVKKNPEDWDEIEVDIRGEGDNSYILSGTIDNNGNRIFNYVRSQQFIRDIIMETLLNVQSVPTGSIHWLPVTYKQYRQLINDTKSYPNHYYQKSDSGDNTNVESDPIIRDYLLCDGRKYKSSHFPELAKILWKENICYWNDNNEIEKHSNGGLSENEITNEETGEVTTVTTYDEYFRVPDLRTKFISYVYAKGVENPLEEEPSGVQTYKKIDCNTTGVYTPDNSPKNASGEAEGYHFHFSAYGSYTAYILSPGRIDSMYNFKGWNLNDVDMSSTSFNPRIWYLQTTAGQHSKKSDIGGYSYGFGSSGNRRREQSTNDIIAATAFVSAPDGGYGSFSNQPSIGLTSKSQMIYMIPNNNEETYRITKYESMTDYNELESGISKKSLSDDENNAVISTTRYGHENSPKFYAMLPLIKI